MEGAKAAIDVPSGSLECPLCEHRTDNEPLADKNQASNQSEETSHIKRMAKHLVLEHHLVIDKIDEIKDIESYLNHWRARFKGQHLKEFCSTIKTNTGPYDLHESEDYYLLSDVLPEDKELRMSLKETPKTQVLEQIVKEREDSSFSRTCMFCRKHFEGNRSMLFDHLAKDHHMRIGRPDNLINSDALLDLIQSKVEELICLYCEKKFKDWNSLKEHMRKKRHKRINPNNKEYDKFYVCNYFDDEDVEDESASSDTGGSNSNEEEEWEEWEECDEDIACLFCDHNSSDPNELFDDHMVVKHQFKFYELTKDLDYYQRVKIINYIRWCYSEKRCFSCEETFPEENTLINHLSAENAERGHPIDCLPQSSQWDSPNFYFPCKDNDPLLYHLRDEDEAD